jgi:hypothetical protein
MVHTIIHRGLTPQTVTHAWLILTLALTFALAIAHSAVQGGPLPSLDGPRASSVAVVRALPAAPAAHALPAAPAAHALAAERDDDATRAIRSRPPGAQGTDPGTAGPLGAPSDATGARGARMLAAIYGGAGPHGPPASGASR